MIKTQPLKKSPSPVLPTPAQCAILKFYGKSTRTPLKTLHLFQMNSTLKRTEEPKKEPPSKGRRLRQKFFAKRSFALAEVLVSLMILGICASVVTPYFKNMFTTYKSILDRMKCEYIVEEQLTQTYAAYLAHPPTFDEIIEEKTTATVIDGCTVLCAVQKVLEEKDSAQPICTAKITICARKGVGESSSNAASALGSMELCFQKGTS
jgi:hypothetical protein